MTFTELACVPSDPLAPFTDQLRLAVAAYLARFKGSSRQHTESDLRCYLTWCAERGLDPLAVRRPHLELYIRWMQEICRFKPSTVSRRFSVTAGFYRTCVIDGILEHSPAEHVRRPAVPAESPTLGFTHLQFEALLTAARESANPCDFALVAMLGLLGLRIRGHRRRHRRPRRRTRPPGAARVRQGHQDRPGPAAASGRPGHRPRDRRPCARADPVNSRSKRMDRHAATRRLRRLAETSGIQVARAHPHMLRHTFVTTMQIGRIASAASFGRSREHALPAAQRAALRCPDLPGAPRGHDDLGLHGPPGSDATMMRLIPLRRVHHGCSCWHRDASGSSRLNRVHHRRSR